MNNLEAVLKYLKDNLGIVFSSDELKDSLTLHSSEDTANDLVVSIRLYRDEESEYDHLVFTTSRLGSKTLVERRYFDVDDKASANLMNMLNRYIPSGLVTLAKASDSTPLACSSEGKLANKKLSEILATLEDSGFKIVSTCDFMNKYRIVVDYDKE